MPKIGFTYWQDGKDWLGYLDEFPDYVTQGESLADLKEHLLDLQRDLLGGACDAAHRAAEIRQVDQRQ
jgi:predicted RNase H-like HicB family nuclease